MPGGTPVGWAQRCTFRDDSLPHQIRIVTNGSQVYASCNCMAQGIGRKERETIGGPLSAGEDAMARWRKHEEEVNGQPERREHL